MVEKILDLYNENRFSETREQLYIISSFIEKYINENIEKDEMYYIAISTATNIVLNFTFKSDFDIYWLKRMLNERNDFIQQNEKVNLFLRLHNLDEIRLDNKHYSFISGYHVDSKYNHFNIIQKELIK